MRWFAIAFVVLFYWRISAQEQIGWRMDRYASLAGADLNPAWPLSSVYPLRWEFRLGAASLFIQNDYLFLESASNIALWNARSNLRIYARPDIGDVPNLPQGAFALDFFQKEVPFQGRTSGSLNGPGLWLRVGEQHAIGLALSARGWLQAWRLPDQLGYYTFDANPIGQSIPITPFEITAQTWREWTLHYSFSWEGWAAQHVLGVQFKWLRGYESLWLDVPQPMELRRLLGDTVAAPANAELSAGYTHTIWSGPDAIFQQPHGRGIGFDIGYARVIHGSRDPWAVRWGVSLVDVGYINYEGAVSWHSVRLDTARLYTRSPYVGFSRFDEVPTLIRRFSYESLGDSLASYQGDHYRLWLPTGLSAQVDISITPWAFVGGMMMIPLPWGVVGSRRNAVLSLNPRLEHRWGSITVPFVWYAWQEVHMGLAARFAFVTIGTDHLGSWINSDVYTGTDVYVSLSLIPFLKGMGMQLGGKRYKKRYKKGRVRCYEF